MSRFRRGRPIGSMRNAYERGDPRKFHAAPLQYWHLADRGITAVADVVSDIADQSGNARHLAQATEARRGTLVSDGGKPAVSFDGSDDFYITGIFTTNQPSTLFLVVHVTPQAAASNHDTVWSRSSSVFLLVDTTPRSILGAGSSITYNSAVANGAYALIEAELNGASGVLRENGTSRATGNVGADAGGRVTLGSLNNAATHSTTIKFREQFELGGILSASELSRIRARLRAKWALP